MNLAIFITLYSTVSVGFAQCVPVYSYYVRTIFGLEMSEEQVLIKDHDRAI